MPAISASRAKLPERRWRFTIGRIWISDQGCAWTARVVVSRVNQ